MIFEAYIGMLEDVEDVEAKWRGKGFFPFCGRYPEMISIDDEARVTVRSFRGGLEKDKSGEERIYGGKEDSKSN